MASAEATFGQQRPSVKFIDHFWGERNRGFDELILNFKKSYQSSDEFHKFVLESANIQSQCSRLFGRLSSQLTKFNATTCFFPMTQLLKKFIDDVVSVHDKTNEEYQNLAEWVAVYNSEKKDKQRSVKESESRTADLIAILNNTLNSLNKVKGQYELYLSDYRRQTQNGIASGIAHSASTKAIDRTEKKLKSAEEEYRSLINKFNAARDEFEVKFGYTCNNFQEIEEQHLSKMKNFALTYSECISACAQGIKDAAHKFASACDEITLDEMLKVFVDSKATGTERPRELRFETASVPVTERSRENMLDWLFPGKDSKKLIAGSLIDSTSPTPILGERATPEMNAATSNTTQTSSINDPFFHSLFLGFFKSKDNNDSAMSSMSNLRKKHRFRKSKAKRNSSENQGNAEHVEEPPQRPATSAELYGPETIQSSYSLFRNNATRSSSLSSGSPKFGRTALENWPIRDSSDAIVNDFQETPSRSRSPSIQSTSSSNDSCGHDEPDIGTRLRFTIQPQNEISKAPSTEMVFYKLSEPPRSRLSRPATAWQQKQHYYDPYEKNSENSRCRSALPSGSSIRPSVNGKQFPMQFDELRRNPSEATLCPDECRMNVNDDPYIGSGGDDAFQPGRPTFDWSFSRCNSRTDSVSSNPDDSALSQPFIVNVPVKIHVGYIHTIIAANKQCVAACFSFSAITVEQLIRSDFLLTSPPLRFSVKRTDHVQKAMINQNLLTELPESLNSSTSSYVLNSMAMQRKLKHKIRESKSNVVVELIKYEIESPRDFVNYFMLRTKRIDIVKWRISLLTCIYPAMKQNLYSRRICEVHLGFDPLSILASNQQDFVLHSNYAQWTVREMNAITEMPGWYGAHLDIHLDEGYRFRQCWIDLDCDVNESDWKRECVANELASLLTPLNIILSDDCWEYFNIVNVKLKTRGRIYLELDQ
ncbi:hypothetical protein ACOME3_008453 [Neoechinorhynchus agilis]